MIEKTLEKITVHTPNGEYPIFLGTGLLGPSPVLAQFKAQGVSSICAIVTNPAIGALYAPRITDSLRGNGFQPHIIDVPDGEQHKTLGTVRNIYDRVIDAQLDRRSIIFALGGGVVGDIAGFVAATFLRGVLFVQLPTTLLAMVDSSIGGKVGVDSARGKNLIGAFNQPLAVIADTDTLATLPDVEFRCGMAEVVKHALLGDKKLFEDLETEDWRLQIDQWLGRAIQVKVGIIERDPFEKDERAKLNLGHTFGHAIEQVSGYNIRHGEGVAIGLVCATRLAANRKLCDVKLTGRVKNLLLKIGLPTCPPRGFSAEAIFGAMQTDKKRVKDRLRFVLPRAVGDVTVVDDVERDEILQVLNESLSN